MENLNPDSSRHTRFRVFFICAGIFIICLHVGLLAFVLSIAIAFHVASRYLVPASDELPAERRGRYRRLGALCAGTMVVIGGMVAALHYGLPEQVNTHALISKMDDVVVSVKEMLPAAVANGIPQPAQIISWCTEHLWDHATEISSAGLGAATQIGYVVIGVILGTLIALSKLKAEKTGPLTTMFLRQADEFRSKLLKVLKAQITISLINTCLTGTYLFAILPLAGIELPFKKTMLVCTFIAGLIPIVGNIASNVIITVISLGHSVQVAFASLGFLIAIHESEHFLNARLISANIGSKSWEILLAMVVMGRFFGAAGLVAAPILYAWAKTEWNAWDAAPASTTDTAQLVATAGTTINLSSEPSGTITKI
jgi:predicted PurR-regulated permease PerM